MIAAIRRLDSNVVLLLIGIGSDAYSQYLLKLGKLSLGERFIALGIQPYDRMPELLALGDIVAIPQRYNESSIGQIPAKLFDAMALGKPIVATAVSDIPEILGDCGWLVKPGDSLDLSQKIKYALDNYSEAQRMGRLARKKCIDLYSLNAIEKTLKSIFKKYE